MNLQEVGYGGRDWIDLVQDGGWWRALVNAVISGSINAGDFLTN
jgi:hypothetical protein